MKLVYLESWRTGEFANCVTDVHAHADGMEARGRGEREKSCLLFLSLNVSPVVVPWTVDDISGTGKLK